MWPAVWFDYSVQVAALCKAIDDSMPRIGIPRDHETRSTESLASLVGPGIWGLVQMLLDQNKARSRRFFGSSSSMNKSTNLPAQKMDYHAMRVRTDPPVGGLHSHPVQVDVDWVCHRPQSLRMRG